MSVFATMNRRRSNRDGTYNVYCSDCGRFVAMTTIQLGKMQCELCRRTEAGEVLTEDMVRKYEAGKLDRSEISYLAIPEEATIKAVGSKMRTMGAGILAAVGLPKKKAVEADKSRAAAAAVSRKRVFESPDALGSLEQIDAALNKGKESQ